jgi:hypothetical protein
MCEKKVRKLEKTLDRPQNPLYTFHITTEYYKASNRKSIQPAEVVESWSW